MGGNVIGSTISIGNIGIPAEQLAAALIQAGERSEKLIAELTAEVRALRKISGETDARLQRFEALRDLHKLNVADLEAEAQKAIEAGDLAKADALVADILDDVRRTAQSFNAYGGVLLPPGFSTDVLNKSAAEIEKLRKENKDSS